MDLSKLKFHDCSDNDIEILGSDEGDIEATRAQMCMRRDAIAKSLFSRKKVNDLQQGNTDLYVALFGDLE